MRFFTPTTLATGVALVSPLACNGFCPIFSSHRIGVNCGAENNLLFQSKESTIEDSSLSDSRRRFFSNVATSVVGLTSATFVLPNVAFASADKVLVLGGTGFIGSRVVSQLRELGVEVIATSRDGRDGTVALDVTTSANVAADVEKLAGGCAAVISTIGAIGSPNDGPVNAATGLAANGAKAAGVKRFVYISVAPEVRESSKGVGFLEDYMKGKTFSEESIKFNFGEGSYTIIEPTFVYGGNSFSVNPPRVASGYGKLVEGLLKSGPFRAAAGVSPGLIGVALEPPVKVEAVAGAAIAGALGKSGSILDTYDKINDAAKAV